MAYFLPESDSVANLVVGFAFLTLRDHLGRKRNWKKGMGALAES